MAKAKLTFFPASSYWSKDSLNNDFYSHTYFSKILQYIAFSWLDKELNSGSSEMHVISLIHMTFYSDRSN